MFYGCSFIFDEIPSESYDLRILDFSISDPTSSPAGSESALYQKYIYRKSRPFFFGRVQNIPLEFDLTVGSLDPIYGIDRNLIEQWLIGRSGYKSLQIVQDDISDTSFDVIFTKASNEYVGRVQRGITLHAQCRLPWGLTFPKTLTKSYSGSAIVNSTFNFYNESAEDDYLRPQLTFALSAIGSNFSLKNVTDNNREFLFTGLSANESMTVDNYRQSIVPSTRLSKFNKNFFRLVPGNNVLILNSAITSFTMTYSFAKKIGA
jgi:hypothetical protein